MHNINELRILIMTLSHTPHRYWYTLGMLDTMGFPIDRCHTVMGKWWRDYADLDAQVEAMIQDGFIWADRFRKKDLPDIERGFLASLWSACRCLRYIAAQPYPHLLIEDDVRFKITYQKFKKKIQTLPADTEIAVLERKRFDGEKFFSDAAGSYEEEAYNDHWLKGTYRRRSGAFISVYTPAGAREALSVASRTGITLENLAPHYPEETTYCAHPERDAIFDIWTAIQEISIQPNDKTHMEGKREEFKGYGHHELYDRWVDGLEI